MICSLLNLVMSPSLALPGRQCECGDSDQSAVCNGIGHILVSLELARNFDLGLTDIVPTSRYRILKSCCGKASKVRTAEANKEGSMQ